MPAHAYSQYAVKEVEHMEKAAVPLIIGGVSRYLPQRLRVNTAPNGSTYQGVDVQTALEAVTNCERAFQSWRYTRPQYRRSIFQTLAKLLHDAGDEACEIMQQELCCSSQWCKINLTESIALIEETAALITSDALAGVIPAVQDQSSYAMVLSEPLGVVLGIAPWNSPMILGLRAVLAPVAAGNTAIFKGSELSPRMHHFLAQLFQDAGFPPGVINFLLHRPQDASEIIEALIKAPAVRKCNFTGSTRVGRSIASLAGEELKPVLLELGGKNCAIVLADANVEAAALAAIDGASLNNGQICMATDLVVVVKAAAIAFRGALRKYLLEHDMDTYAMMTMSGREHLDGLIQDAHDQGAHVLTSKSAHSSIQGHRPFTVLEDVTPEMRFFGEESFGPVLGIHVVETEEDAIAAANTSKYGLSSSIWTRDHFAAIRVARSLAVGAVHVNASTVHDEATLPHGGCGLSGYGRFGGPWGLREFVQTKTIIMHP